MTIEEAEKRSIIKILAGSHIHGLNVETSDKDYEAIVVEPLQEVMGLQKPFEELIRESEEADSKYVSLRKWCQLALKGNPNFLLVLFAPSENVVKQHSLGSRLRALKDAFLSKQAIKSHLGYMQGQRQRMLRQSNGGRGQPRTELVEKFGYDTKFAMHLLRLGHQGVELAEHGKITLPVTSVDRRFLRDVRHGDYSLDMVLRVADEMEGQMKAAFDRSPLPDKPDYAAVEQFMLRAYSSWWSADRRIEQWREDIELFPKSTIGTNRG
jgi:predicted nucleotidyltransferase